MSTAEPGVVATHSGLRGRPGSELTPELVRRTVGGLIALLRGRALRPAIAIARDERPSGEELAAEAIDAALAAGADVTDLGVLPTPASKLAARRRGLGGAVIVTGSHLEPELNGIKLVAAPSYGPLDVRRLPQPPAPAGRRGRLGRDDGATAEHVAAVIDSIDADTVHASGLSVAWQGGAGDGPAQMLERLGCASAASPDLGLALDADGDRLELSDEAGDGLDPEHTLALTLLARGARSIVKGADTSRLIEVLAERGGGSVRVVPPGEIHLVSALEAGGGDLAGEGNGGVIVPAVGLARDGLAAAASIIWLLARSGRSLSELDAELPRFVRRRSTLPAPDPATAWARLDALARRLGLPPADPSAGLRLERGPWCWGLVRVSATEPVIRVTVEAESEEQADSLHAELLTALDGGAG